MLSQHLISLFICSHWDFSFDKANLSHRHCTFVNVHSGYDAKPSLRAKSAHHRTQLAEHPAKPAENTTKSAEHSTHCAEHPTKLVEPPTHFSEQPTKSAEPPKTSLCVITFCILWTDTILCSMTPMKTGDFCQERKLLIFFDFLTDGYPMLILSAMILTNHIEWKSLSKFLKKPPLKLVQIFLYHSNISLPIPTQPFAERELFMTKSLAFSCICRGLLDNEPRGCIWRGVKRLTSFLEIDGLILKTMENDSATPPTAKRLRDGYRCYAC